MNRMLPFRLAFFFILLSVLVISGTSFLGYLYLENLKEIRKKSDRYRVVAIAQTCSNGEVLPTQFFAELFELSVDKPANLYQFNTQDAQRKLLACPFIKEAFVKKISPGTIYVDYKLRIPVAFLADFANLAIDYEGYAFPFAPFFSLKNLPEIYLGEEYGYEKTQLALELLTLLEKKIYGLKRIDVSRAFASSYGQREVIVSGENEILRLAADNYSQQIANFLTLRRFLHQEKRWDKVVIDLRIQELAFISSNL